MATSTLWWSNHHDIHREWSQRRQLLRHALTRLLEQGRASCQHDIGVQFLAGVSVALRQEGSVVDPPASYWEIWLEQLFCETETFGVNSDEVSVWELVGLLLVSRFELCVVTTQM